MVTKLSFSIILLFLVLPLGAQTVPTFKHIKFTKEALAVTQSPAQASAMSGKTIQASSPVVDSLSKKVIALMFPENALKAASLKSPFLKAVSSATSTIPTDGEEPPLYQNIRDYLGDSYTSIGNDQVSQIQAFNNQFNLGSQNYSGFAWQKPFGSIGVNVFRQLSPDLFDQTRWIVQDTFTINIEATSFLSQLKDGGVVDMADSDIAAFAGITFKRTFTSYHYSDSYLNGLKTDFTYLFLPFLNFTSQKILTLSQGEVLKREDMWSAGVGGILTVPLGQIPLSVSAGILAQWTHSSQMTVQSVLPSEQSKTGEFLRLSHQGQNTKSAGAAASLQLDFFNLIKFTLLSYDFEYSSTNATEFSLSFQEKDREELAKNAPLASEFKSVLSSSYPTITYLEPYVSSLNETQSSSTVSRLNVLLYGSLKKTDLEQVRVIKNQVTTTFFKSYDESVRYIQSFWSRLFSSAFFRIFNFKTQIKNASSLSKQLQIEYDATLPQAADPQKMSIQSAEQFSLTLNLNYEAARTKGWFYRRYKNDTKNFLRNYTTLSPDISTMISNDQLRGPLLINSSLRIAASGLVYFNALNPDLVFTQFAAVCKSERPADWANADLRVKMMKQDQTGNELCVKNFGDIYANYKQIYNDLNRIDLYQLKKMITRILTRMSHFEALKNLFGEDTFVNGSFAATTSDGSTFQTQYSAGQFKGLGLIDNFVRTSSARSPASIMSDAP